MSLVTVIQFAERQLPHALRRRTEPVRLRLQSVLTAENDTARAQRMALTAFAIRVLSAGIAFLSQIIQARLMGEFEYGIFAFVWVLVVVFGNLSCLGMHTAVIRFLPQHRSDDDHGLVRGLAWTVRVFAMVSASILAVIGFTILHVAGESIAEYWLIPLFLALFALPMIALGDVLDGTARAHGWTVTALSPTYIIRPVLILAFMLGAIWIGEPRTAVTAMTAALAATYTTTLFQFIRISWRLRRTYGRGALRFSMLPWMKFSLPIFLIDGIGFLLTNSDVVVVGLYMPPDQVGVYYAAAKTIALVQFVYFAVKAAAAPRFSAIMAARDDDALAGFAGQAARWAFWPALAVGLCVLALGEFLLSLFGSAFTAGYVLMVILFAGILAKASIGPGEILLSMAGKQKLCVAVYAITLVVSISLNVSLIPHFGLIGAASATAGAMVVEAVLLHIAVRRVLGIVLFAFADPRSTHKIAKARS